jgi:hypothetical protein
MASPSRAEVESQWKAAVNLLEYARRWGNVEATNWVGLEDTLTQAVESDFAAAILSSAARSRSFLAQLLSNSNAAAHLLPHLRSYNKHVVNGPDLSDPQLMFDRMVQYMWDNSYTVNSRDFSFGSPAAGGGNVGNGVILRLNTDDHNFTIENQHADAKTAKVVLDGNSGTAKHEELIEFYGQSPGIDGLQVTGSGKSAKFNALSARASQMLNPSFSQFAGTTSAPTDITSWTSSVTVNSTNYSIDESNYYRDFQGDSTPRALNIKVTGNLTQRISVGNFKLRPDRPYMLRIAWNRQVGSASGTLVIRMGAVNNSVAVAAQTGWQLLYVVASPSQNNWLRQFNEQNLDVAIEWTRTGGELLLDDVMLVPAYNFDGSWYWPIGGSTPFLKDDVFTWTDTETGAVLQRWAHRAFGRSFPSATGGAETWTDP